MLRLPLFSIPLLLFFVRSVIANTYSAFNSKFSEMLSNASYACSGACAPYAALNESCHTQHVLHCGCNVKYLKAQGDCLICQSNASDYAASVQFLLDDEIDQCRSEGIKVDFQLELPPAAAVIVQRVNNMSEQLRQQQIFFLALQIAGGHIGLVIFFLFAIFSRKVQRDPTFFNFCISWIFSSVVFSILLYPGIKGHTILNSLGRVSTSTCLTQAALANGVQVMTACSTMALVIQLWLTLRATIRLNANQRPKQAWWITMVLLTTPYILFLAFFMPSIFVGDKLSQVGGSSTKHVLPTSFYCMVVEVGPFVQAVFAMTLGLLLITLIFDGLIISMMYRHWRNFQFEDQNKGGVSLSAMLRVVIFSTYRVLVAIAYGAVLKSPPTEVVEFSGVIFENASGIPTWVDMLQAAVPLIGFLVMGVNYEMTSSLLFWRKKQLPAISLGRHTERNRYQTMTVVDTGLLMP